MSWKDAKREGRQEPEKEYAGFVNLESEGDFVIGRVTALKENENGRYLVMERRDGARFNFGVPTYLDNNFDVPDLVGVVVGVGWTDSMDVGKASPMKVVEVLRFGDDFPSVEGVESTYELPF